MNLTRSHWLIAALAAVAALPACRRSRPEAPPPADVLPPRELTRDKPHVFIFANPEGAFETTDDPEKVPPAQRRLVRVIDPASDESKRRDSANVYVADLDRLLREGKVTARPVPRDVFETGALALLPPGESSALTDAPGAAGLPTQTDAGAGSAGAEHAVVILYGASWCGACKAARSYLAGKGVPFADKDIEGDQAAARELAQKAARAGVSADRIPVLDVRGRLLIGFDQPRLDRLLGDLI